MYEACIIKVVGEFPFILKILNVIYSVGTTVFIYRITSKVFNEFCGRIAGTVYAFYIPSIIMSSVLTNEHLSTFLFYLGFYLLVSKGIQYKYTWLYIGILLSLGDITRPLGAFVLLAVILYVFVFSFIGSKTGEKSSIITKFIGFIVAFYVVHYLVSYSFMAAGITSYPLSNREPYWKFVLGFNHGTVGQYSNEDAKYVSQFPIGNERDEREKQLVKERITDKKKLAVLFKNKFKIMWGSNDASISWSLGTLNKPNLSNLFFMFERAYYMVMMAFAFVAAIVLCIKDENKRFTLFLLLIIGYVCVHFLIEVQTRYRSFIIPSFAIIQSYGIYLVYRFLPIGSKLNK
ncbi:hypothetical protein [Bacillus sp. 165]|uniref:hypothetical protein n=1 Tax=Bacillus sp. 165 TaxID=1529117 RepID=UPI001FFE206C|nr:hypothetical protein [Bacillus sp. 165]